MSWSRISLLSLVAVSAAVLAGALAQQPAPNSKKAKKAPSIPNPQSGAADVNAQKAITASIEMLDRKRMNWLEMTLWQQVDVQGLLYQSEGVYLAGPDYRLRLDLRVHVDDISGKMNYICDGTTLWEVSQFGDKPPQVSTKEMKTVREASAELRENFMQRWPFAGIAPLMQGLQQRMVFTKMEPMRWKDRTVQRLTGVWSPEVVKTILPTEKSTWPVFLPRSCYLYLDAQTHWPHRLEWWGPSPPREGDALLMQMECRNPRFTEMSAERCAKVFTYRPAGEAARAVPTER